MEPETTMHERIGAPIVIALIGGAMIGLAGFVLLIGALGQLIWLAIAAVFNLGVQL